MVVNVYTIYTIHTGCPNKFETEGIAPVLGCAAKWLIPHRVRLLGSLIHQYEWLPPGPFLGKYFLKTSNFVSMETRKILYLLFGTTKFKAEYPIVYPVTVIVYHEILDFRSMMYQKKLFFSFQLKQINWIYAKYSLNAAINSRNDNSSWF